MKNRKMSYLILLACWIIILAVCGTVVAYMFMQTDYKENTFTPATVSCVVHEETDSTDNSNTENITQKTGITVENTGNIDAYLRVRLVSYWVKVTQSGGYEITAKASEMPEISVKDGWLQGPNHTYYYQSPVSSNESNNCTGELLAAPIQLKRETAEDGSVYLQVIEVFAEAIQSKPADAVTSAWQVALDDSGNITAIQ